jgi:hypothetical protein
MRETKGDRERQTERERETERERDREREARPTEPRTSSVLMVAATAAVSARLNRSYQRQPASS